MKRRKVLIIISILLLTIGVSFASWIITLNQTNNNLISSKCFNVTLSEENPINLTGAYPITDTEGSTLTPFTFTITNTCNSNASYQVNLEILNTTTLASTEVKVMLDDGTPALLSSKTVTTKTLDNATTAYILKTGFLDPNESVTYNLRLWIDESSTTEASANKTFSSKITVSAGYKDSVTNMDRCEAEYGEGAAACNIIASADPDNSKCLQVDENGMILNPTSTTAEPIVCTMEDDYGTSYYLRGNHQDNNVKFANMCWKLVRVTGTGGLKLIYNGDLDENGKCTITSGEHNGFYGNYISLSGDKVYGTSYTKEGDNYILKNTTNLNWNRDINNILGKYTCGDSNTTCNTLYLVIDEVNSTQGYALQINQKTNYAQIGGVAFNINYDSPSYVGYMYNDVYKSNNKLMWKEGEKIISSQLSNETNYYYGDTISYSGNYYYITNRDGSNIQQLSWAENYENLPGKYTCKSTSKYNDTTIRCWKNAYKVLDTTSKANYMVSENLSEGKLAIGTIKLSNGYTDNGDGTYTLNSPVTEKSAMEWYNEYSSFNNYYVCEDYNQTSCSNLYKIVQTDQSSFKSIIDVSNNYFYGQSFSYNKDDANPYTLTNTINFFDAYDTINQTSLDTHHYTCFKSTDNTCDELYYIYKRDYAKLYYIKLNGNENVSNPIKKMLVNNDINVKDSTIKKAIDMWYEQNIRETEYENKIEDTAFCNDRTIDDLGGWNETGSINENLRFNSFQKKYYLKCPSKRDAFTVSDMEKGNGSLNYPIGLLSIAESSLIGNDATQNTGRTYWTISPISFDNYYAYVRNMFGQGGWCGWYYTNCSYGARPSISLKPGIKFVTGGDGSASNPYEVDMDS